MWEKSTGKVTRVAGATTRVSPGWEGERGGKTPIPTLRDQDWHPRVRAKPKDEQGSVKQMKGEERPGNVGKVSFARSLEKATY